MSIILIEYIQNFDLYEKFRFNDSSFSNSSNICNAKSQALLLHLIHSRSEYPGM